MSSKGVKRRKDDVSDGEEECDNFKKTNGKETESFDEDDELNDEEDHDLDDDVEDEDLNGDEESDEEDGEECDEDESEDSNEEFLNKEIEVEFAAFNPEPDDFHGIKSLLQRLWLKENIDLSELTEMLINENTIASVLKQENDDDNEKEGKGNDSESESDDDDKDNVYGIISLIPFCSYYATKKCVIQIKDLLLSYIPKDNEIHKKLIDSKITCALVINERFLNLPPKISLPCYQGLVSEVAEYNQSKSEDEEISYHFDYIIMICKVLKQKNNKSDQFTFINAEDEIFSDAANDSFEYSVANQCDSDVFDWKDDQNLFEPYRKVLLLTKPKWLKTVDLLKNVV